MNSNASNMNGERAYSNYGRLDAMAAYDRLPKVLRKALQESDHNWAGAQCLHELRKPKAKRREQFTSAERAARFIREADQAKHVKDIALGVPVCPRVAAEA